MARVLKFSDTIPTVERRMSYSSGYSYRGSCSEKPKLTLPLFHFDEIVVLKNVKN